MERSCKYLSVCCSYYFIMCILQLTVPYAKSDADVDMDSLPHVSECPLSWMPSAILIVILKNFPNVHCLL